MQGERKCECDLLQKRIILEIFDKVTLIENWKG